MLTTPDPPDGAFTIGGGDYSYGQDYTEEGVRALFTVPRPTIGSILESFNSAMSMLPLSTLKHWKDYIGGDDDDYATHESATTFIREKFINYPYS